MSGTQKRGFRLPWAAERGPDDGSAAATLDPELDPSVAAAIDDLGANPFKRAGSASPDTSTGAAPAASPAPEGTAEASMIETESPMSEPGAGPPAAKANGAWPVSDQTGTPEHASDARRAAARPPIHVEGEPRVGRRENPLVAGLVKAMREAAIASRAETTNRLRAEATARVEAIRAGATDAAAALRKRAEEDIAGIREWSKAEIARVRQQTEERIETRRVELAGETERQVAGIDHMVEEVETTVAAYEADMDSFFELLLSENDPARLATLAEQAPEAPDMTGDADYETDWQDARLDSTPAEAVGESAAPTSAGADEGDLVQARGDAEAQVADVAEANAADGAASDAVAATTGPDDAGSVEAETPAAEAHVEEALEAAAAAEAEAEATEGLDMVTPDRWPAAVMGSARPEVAPTNESVPESTGQSRLLVSGLTSVAGISAFKGAVGGLPGVRSVSVSSGERGVFIFSVSHEASANIAESVAGMTGFAVRITESTGDSITIVAHEPAA